MIAIRDLKSQNSVSDNRTELIEVKRIEEMKETSRDNDGYNRQGLDASNGSMMDQHSQRSVDPFGDSQVLPMLGIQA